MDRYGVYSEVGKLRKVLVHRPDLSLQRLTPSNMRELLFDDVLWVKRARQEHDLFVERLRAHGVEVLLVSDLLADTMNDPAARTWVLDRKLTPNQVGLTASLELRPWFDEMDGAQLATLLIGGLTYRELPREMQSLASEASRPDDFVLPPLPNQLFTRDTSCWIYNGVTLNPMYWPARRFETLNIAAIYRFHPDFQSAGFEIWYGDADQDTGQAHLEGGDVMPIGKGTVLVGMGERTTPQAIEELTRSLFARGGAERVIAAQMPRERAYMHLDTVFTFCDRDVVTVYAPVVDHIQAFTIRPGTTAEDLHVRREEKPFLAVVAEALGVRHLRTITTGGGEFEAEREQWEDGNNVLALAPGVVMAYEHDDYTNTKQIVLIFEKDSTRTRSGFEVAAYDQGAHVTYMGPSGSHIGSTESLKDTARVLDRMYDGIEFRGFAQAEVEELARYAGVPVWNGLTNQAHPTQILADFLTMQEHTHKPLEAVSFCFLGNVGYNMGDSLMIGAAKMGMEIRLAGPRSSWPKEARTEQALAVARETGARITLTEDALAAVKGCDFLYTDVWVSMGEPAGLWGERIKAMQPYRVTGELMAATGNPATKFMHCLPSLHSGETVLGKQLYEKYGLDGLEVTDEVFESRASIVFDQAENRLHTIKAVLVATLGG